MIGWIYTCWPHSANCVLCALCTMFNQSRWWDSDWVNFGDLSYNDSRFNCLENWKIPIDMIFFPNLFIVWRFFSRGQFTRSQNKQKFGYNFRVYSNAVYDSFVHSSDNHELITFCSVTFGPKVAQIRSKRKKKLFSNQISVHFGALRSQWYKKNPNNIYSFSNK